LQCVAVCCSVLQCVAVCCSVLQCVAVCTPYTIYTTYMTCVHTKQIDTYMTYVNTTEIHNIHEKKQTEFQPIVTLEYELLHHMNFKKKRHVPPAKCIDVNNLD